MTPPLATFGVTPTYGNFRDRFVGKAIRWSTATRDNHGHYHDSPVNHAVLFVGDVVGYDKPQLVEARPGGAGFCDWDAYGSSMIWIPYAITDDQANDIVAFGKDCAIKKIGYGYADFLAIALAQERFGREVHYDRAAWWVKRLGRENRLICSQLVDYAYYKSGVHLFNDGRPSGLVSPNDLYQLGHFK